MGSEAAVLNTQTIRHGKANLNHGNFGLAEDTRSSDIIQNRESIRIKDRKH